MAPKCVVAADVRLSGVGLERKFEIFHEGETGGRVSLWCARVVVIVMS
jgi:hypothetical protein